MGYEIPISLDLSDVVSLQEDPHELFLFPSELAESADLEQTVYAGAAVRALQSCHLQLSNKPGICKHLVSHIAFLTLGLASVSFLDLFDIFINILNLWLNDVNTLY